MRKYPISVVVYAVEINTFDIQDRQIWGALPPKVVQHMNHTVPFVVIHHSEIPKACNTTTKCIAAMRSMQAFHQNVNGWADISYR